MAYQASREGGNADLERQRNNANNTNNVRNAADVAIASKNPYGVAAGAAVKGLDKATGGKASEAMGRAMTRANDVLPMGNHFQNASNRLSESGLSNRAGQLANVKNRANSGGATPNQAARANHSGGESDSSLPSSSLERKQNVPNRGTSSTGADANASSESKDDKPRRGFGGSESSERRDSLDANMDGEEEQKGKGFFGFAIGTIAKMLIITIAPMFLVAFLMVAIIGGVSGLFTEYEDAVGISEASGDDTGGISFEASSQEQQDFYDRVNDLKLKYQANGKTIDSLKVVSVIHVLNSHGAGISYSDLNEGAIAEIANSMFDGNVYNETTFRNNLKNFIIPKYVKNVSPGERDQIVDDIFDYIDGYNNMIGRNSGTSDATCLGNGTCTYDVKGFYINGKGNVSKALQISDLYVRLMQCGVGDGHNYGGTFGKPLEGESLVPFEKYILGVAYQEIGPNSPAEAIKAQMIAARSYILARHVDMGGWRTLKQESDGKWVIQVASCTQDQVYCDPDQGCSSNDGQWGQVHSGLNHNTGFSRGALAQNSPLRTYAQQTSGEVLVNAQGYIVYSGYTQDEQNKFIALANSGLSYKQILLQVYNQGARNYGAKNIEKSSCGNSTNCSSIPSGEYSNWKQIQGPWIGTPMGNSGKTLQQIGCLVTSVSMLIAKSGVPTTINDFNPGNFVNFLNANNGFADGGNFLWETAEMVAPSFKYQGNEYLLGMSKQEKLKRITEIVNTPGIYAVAEVMGNTGQHWVAIDSVSGESIKMMDPGSYATDMWTEYNWANTSMISYYKVG